MFFSRSIVVLMIVAAQFASTVRAASLVVCFGMDGHVAVEAAHDDCDRPSTAPGDSSGLAGGAWMMGVDATCNDVPLGVLGSATPVCLTMRESQAAPQIQPPVALGTLALPAFERAEPRRWRDPRNLPDSTLSPLRTVVLTI